MATRRTAAFIIVWRPEAVRILTVAVFDGQRARYGSQPASCAALMASTRFRAFILVTMLVR